MTYIYHVQNIPNSHTKNWLKITSILIFDYKSYITNISRYVCMYVVCPRYVMIELMGSRIQIA